MTTNSQPMQTKVDLTELYQEVILEHSKRPRFKGRTEHCQFCLAGKNPLCGDDITIYCQVNSQQNKSVLNLHFEGTGCSISQASASILCASIQNVTLDEAKKKLKYAEDVYTGKLKLNSQELEDDLEALNGVSQFPVRIKCAALPWKTLEILLLENFDDNGNPKPGCNKLTNCVQNNTKKLKVISTEN